MDRPAVLGDRLAVLEGHPAVREASAAKAAIGAAAAIVTPDSGALHVAGFTGTPTVAVFPPERNFELQVERWSPWAAPYRIVRGDTDWPKRAAEALDQLL